MRQPLARDTALAVEARQTAFFRQRVPTERLAMLFDLTAFAMSSSRDAIRRARPELSPLDQARLFAELLFGPKYAARVRSSPSIEGTMAIPAAILPVTRVFVQMGIPYYIGGSIAGSAYSLPRTTYDVDMIADMQASHVVPFVVRLDADYYVDRGAILDALVHRSSFNMMHHATGINIDVFIPGDRPFDRIQFSRVQAHMLPGTDEPVNLASPEDVILNKLAWYVLGNYVSDQQWRDVQALLRVQGDRLDTRYLRHWAAALDLSTLLEFALRGERPPPREEGHRQEPLF
jgi:hypothetical protein